MWVEAADGTIPAPGSFVLEIEWVDNGGAPMFYPPDPFHVGNELGVVFIQSHHLNYDSGNETMLQHVYRLEIPEGSPVRLSTFFAQQLSSTKFEIYVELAALPASPKTELSTCVFELTHEAMAGAKDLSTAAPVGGLAPRLTLKASPNVTGAFTRLSLSQTLERSSLVDIHDLRGRRVRRLQIPARGTQVEWDGRNDRGQDVSSGTYFARLVGGGARAEKIVLLK
jgi:hypothetical protein